MWLVFFFFLLLFVLLHESAKRVEILVKRIQEAGYFALIANETTDASIKEQVSMCAFLSLKQAEMSLGFYETASTTGESLSAILLKGLRGPGDCP